MMWQLLFPQKYFFNIYDVAFYFSLYCFI